MSIPSDAAEEAVLVFGKSKECHIKLFPLSCDMWHNLGVFPAGLYVLCRSGKESTPGLLGFLWSVPAGIWGIRPALFLDQWSRICFLGGVLGKAKVILVDCFHWCDSEAQPKLEGMSPTSDPWVCIPAQSEVFLVHPNLGWAPCRYS